jgi:hypothetical protein
MKIESTLPKSFHFSSFDQMPSTDNALVGIIEAGISDSARLLRSIASTLDFPAYFGCNWNALYDCLRDFHWTEKKHIFLFHRDVPPLSPQELHTYLGILRDAAADWKPDESHLLHVGFEERDKELVLSVLNAKK